MACASKPTVKVWPYTTNRVEMPVLLAHQAVTHPATVVTPPVEVIHWAEVRIEVQHAFNEAVANTNPQSIIVQTSISDSGDDDWNSEVNLATAIVTPESEVFTATEPIDEKTIAVASTAGFAPGDFIYIRDTVPTDSEWAFIKEIVTDTSIILVDGLTKAHTLTTTTIFGSAQQWAFHINIQGIMRIRQLYQNEGADAANTHVRSDYRQAEPKIQQERRN